MEREMDKAFAPVWKFFLEFQCLSTLWAERIFEGQWSEDLCREYFTFEKQKSELDRRILGLRVYEEVAKLPNGEKVKPREPRISWIYFVAQSLMIRMQELYCDYLRSHQLGGFPIAGKALPAAKASSSKKVLAFPAKAK